VDKVAPKLLEGWTGPPELAHQFVILMDKAKVQRESARSRAGTRVQAQEEGARQGCPEGSQRLDEVTVDVEALMAKYPPRMIRPVWELHGDSQQRV